MGNREGKEEDADGADEGVHAELVLGRRAGGAVAAAAAVALFYCALHLRARRARLEAGAQVSCCHACARRGSYFLEMEMIHALEIIVHFVLGKFWVDNVVWRSSISSSIVRYLSRAVSHRWLISPPLARGGDCCCHSSKVLVVVVGSAACVAGTGSDGGNKAPKRLFWKRPFAQC